MDPQFINLGLHAATPLIQNYDTIYAKSKKTVKKHLPISKHSRGKSRGRYSQSDDDDYDDDWAPPRRSNTDNVRPARGYYTNDTRERYYRRDGYDPKRSNSVEAVARGHSPPRPRSAQQAGRSTSAGNRDNYARDGRRGRRDGRRIESSSDSEASISPRPRDRRRRPELTEEQLAAIGAGAAYGARQADTSRREAGSAFPQQPQNRPRSGDAGAVAIRNNNQEVRSTTRDDSSSDSESDSDSSSVLSSSEDERMRRKMKTKELLTAGLAAVATIHAASGVYSSWEARQKRHEAVKKGELSKEQARKETNKNRLQDAAAIGIAALGIKGAYSKWQQANETHKGYKEHKHAKRQRHELREQKRAKSRNGSQTGDRLSNSRPQYNRAYSRSVPDLGRGDRRSNYDR